MFCMFRRDPRSILQVLPGCDRISSVVDEKMVSAAHVFVPGHGQLLAADAGLLWRSSRQACGRYVVQWLTFLGPSLHPVCQQCRTKATGLGRDGAMDGMRGTKPGGMRTSPSGKVVVDFPQSLLFRKLWRWRSLPKRLGLLLEKMQRSQLQLLQCRRMRSGVLHQDKPALGKLSLLRGRQALASSRNNRCVHMAAWGQAWCRSRPCRCSRRRTRRREVGFRVSTHVSMPFSGTWMTCFLYIPPAFPPPAPAPAQQQPQQLQQPQQPQQQPPSPAPVSPVVPPPPGGIEQLPPGPGLRLQSRVPAADDAAPWCGSCFRMSLAGGGANSEVSGEPTGGEPLAIL